ncbi:SLEI domain protein, PF07620 family [Leptospira interrogans serovar Valbuzzi str. Duyster]|nr:SLEI domain protein, PF07620 family [Leptospira interrogans serovar Valbuzzi str. Duyster]ENO72080.1 SLEI domain protein, PF07620 family [Leptospira interrogans serovar Valbuzzi str. Valbuzzi]
MALDFFMSRVLKRIISEPVSKPQKILHDNSLEIFNQM